MAAKRWSDEQRAEALQLLKSMGPADVAAQLGIPRETIKSWAKRAGVSGAIVSERRAHVEAAELTMEARRLESASRAEEEARALLDRMRAPMSYAHVKTVSGGQGAASEVETVWVDLPMPTPADQLNLARAYATLMEKVQLLTGEATTRPDLGGYDLEGELHAYQQGVADREATER